MADGDNEQGQQEEQAQENQLHTVSGGSLSDIYQRLNSAPMYHPLDADTFGDWSVQAGDKVTLSRDGSSYTSPVLSSRMTWRKGTQIQYSATGNKERPSLAKLSQQKYEGQSAAGNAAGGGGGYGSSRYLHWMVQDRYGQMQSGLELTESSVTLYAQGLYDGMGADLVVTRSAITATVLDLYGGMMSELQITATAITQNVNNLYSGMSSELVQTASSIYATVNSYYDQMAAGLAVTMSSAYMYATSQDCAAQIFLEANKEGSNIRLNADRVIITGETLLSGKVTIDDTDHFFKVKDSMYVDGSIYLYTPNSYMKAPSFRTTAGGDLIIYGNTPTQYRTLDYDSVGNFLNYANASGNTLTIRSVAGTTTNFSKAITHDTPTWSSGHMTVHGQMKNTNTATGQLYTENVYTIDQYIETGNREDYSNTGTWYIPINVRDNPNSQTSVSTGCRVYVDCSAIRTAGQNSVGIQVSGTDGWTYSSAQVSNHDLNNNTFSAETTGKSSNDTESEGIQVTTGSWNGRSMPVYIIRTRSGSHNGEHVCYTNIYAPSLTTPNIDADYDNSASAGWPTQFIVHGKTDQGGDQPETIKLVESSGRIYIQAGSTKFGSVAMDSGQEYDPHPSHIAMWFDKYDTILGAYIWYSTELPSGVSTIGDRKTFYFDNPS